MSKAIYFCALFIIILLTPSVSFALKEKLTEDKVKAKLVSLSIPFIENTGQVENDEVSFYAKTFGGTVFITKNGEIVYSLPKIGSESGVRGSEFNKTLVENRAGILPDIKHKDIESKEIIKGIALKEKLVGGKVKEVKGDGESLTKVSYFKGNDPSKWKNNIPTHNLVSLGEVYEGIELNLKAYGNNVEKLFSVKPGANIEDIKLRLEGAKGIKVNEKGELEVETELGVVKFTNPIAYQEIDGKSIEVEGAYTVYDKNTYGFQVASYNREYPLIIDPVLIYSTYLGGEGYDTGFSVTVDGSGNVYLTGDTAGAFPTKDPLQPNRGGKYEDAFVSKINATGSALVYSTYLGGSDRDFGLGIAVDDSGNAYIIGQTSSTDFPIKDPLQPNPGGDCDAFVAKINASGNTLIYSTFLGGSNFDYGVAIAIDGLGNVYVTGETGSNDFPTKNPLQPDLRGFCDAFVSKINVTGSALVYSTYLGGSNHEHGAGRVGFGIAVDGAGNAYVTGGTCSTDFPIKNPIQANPAGNCDAFVSKLDASGNTLIYSTFLGGGGTDWAYDIAVDNSGNAYVTGSASLNFPTKDAFQPNLSGASDAFVTKINASGSALVYSTYLGGSDTDLGFGIAVDSSGNAYVVGTTMSTNFPIKDPIQANYGGGAYYGWDAFVAEIHASGALVYSTYLGGIYTDKGFGIAVDSSGNTYVTGETGSYNFPTKDPLQPNHGDGIKPYTDAFVTKIRPSTDPDITLAPTSHNFCSVTLMSSSAAQIFTILNAGTADLVISPISITGVNASEFSKQNDTCSGQTISPSSNCTVEVVFSPTSEGEKSANLSIPSNDPVKPTLDVPLEGVGLPEGILGDINKDSFIDISDVILVLRISLGLDPIKSCPDIDASCTVDISDVILTLRMALGLDSLKLCAE